MSLNVYLEGPPETHKCTCTECWNEHERTVRQQYYSDNITHNLNKMAGEAGIYEHLWRPDEIGITTARELIAPLQAGLERLKLNPAYFKQFEPTNKWGSYDGLVRFVTEYIEACAEYPDASVHVSR